MKISVVGSGTAGLVSALILKTRFPDYQVDIVCSKRIGIIGVGEGSTEHWTNFANFVGIPTGEMITKCDATMKIGIMFKDWGVPDYMHSIQDGYNLIWQSTYPHIYGKLVSDNVPSKEMSGEIFWDNNIQNWFLENNRTPVAQYHFDTFKLNDYLTNIALERGITIYHDEITDVILNDDGEIDKIISEDAEYKYDFYIDCTGFKKFLISKLGAKWISHKDYLKTNSAIVFQTPDTENYNMWSLAKAMDSGWLFRTPVFGRWGNGYIYDDEFLTPEQAKAEVEQVLGHEIKIGQHIKFDPGALDTAWIKNCCAIGLSSSFVEPLEASSIGASIQQCFLLISRIVNYNQDSIDKYNGSVRSIVENIRDFIALHFVCPRRDTPFWCKVADAKLPPSLEQNLNVWRNNLPISEDFENVSKYALFKELHFLLVLHGLNLFDAEKIKKEYETLPEETKEYAVQVIEDLRKSNSATQDGIMTHKAMLEKIRNHGIEVFARGGLQ
jgi:tryptophan halogenase